MGLSDIITNTKAISYNNIYKQTIYIDNISMERSIHFDRCDRCNIILNCKLTKVVVNNCQDLEIFIKNNMVIGISIYDSAGVKIKDNDDYVSSIDIFNCREVDFDTYGKYYVTVENSENIIMNKTILSIGEYSEWRC